MSEHILFTSDFHLGLSRTAGTTPESRLKLRDLIQAQTQEILDLGYGILERSKASGPALIKRVCLGDFFDTYSNSEETLLHTWKLFQSLDLIVAGNHDVTNRKGTIGSLQYFDHLAGKKSPVCLTKFGSAKVHTYTVGTTHLVIVPHMASQELFEKALENAVAKTREGCHNLLLLHCNFELEFAHSETTLNLTRDRARDLLGHFHHILLGHEHNPRDVLDNRLHVIGCPFPTSFADMTDKRVLLWDVGAAQFETIPVWDLASGCHEMTPSQSVEHITASFVRIRGEVPAQDLAQVMRNVKTLWKENTSLLAVSAEIKIAGEQPEGGEGFASSSASLIEIVQNELRGTDLLVLFNDLLEEARRNTSD